MTPSYQCTQRVSVQHVVDHVPRSAVDALAHVTRHRFDIPTEPGNQVANVLRAGCKYLAPLRRVGGDGDRQTLRQRLRDDLDTAKARRTERHDQATHACCAVLAAAFVEMNDVELD